MGGGSRIDLNFGSTFGSLQLIGTEKDWIIPRSLSAAARNYNIKDSKTGRTFKFIEGSRVYDVEIFAGRGARKRLKAEVAEGLSKQIGGRPKDWSHLKGKGSIDYYGKSRLAEIHWFETKKIGKVKFMIKRWLD